MQTGVPACLGPPSPSLNAARCCRGRHRTAVAACRVAVGREEALEGLAADPSQLDCVAAVECKGSFMFDPASHRDFLGAGQSRRGTAAAGPALRMPCTSLWLLGPELPTPADTSPPRSPPRCAPLAGACLGTGIERSKVGDIILCGEQGAQILCAPTLVEHLESTLTQARAGSAGGWAGRAARRRSCSVGACVAEARPLTPACPPQVRSVPVTTRALALGGLQVRVARVEELSSVEASLRLDAVASAGFRMSRSKMADLVKAGALPLCCAVLWGAVEPRAWFSRDAGGVGVQPWVGVVGACVRRGDLRHATKARARPCTPALQAMCASTGGRGGRAAARWRRATWSAARARGGWRSKR